VASLAGLPVSEIRPLLTELTRSRLLTEHQPGRFRCHDLLRDYAAELTRELDADTDRRAALDRLLDFYLHTAHCAHVLLRPHETPANLTPSKPGMALSPLADYGQAMNWFSLERLVLNAAVSHAAHNGFGAYAWQLALTLQQFYQRQGYWHDWAATMRTALKAADDLGDVAGQARIHRSLAGACHFLGNQDEALAHLERTRELFTELGYTTEQAYVHSNFGAVLGRRGQYEQAIGHHRQALDLYRTTGHEKGQATALEGIGWCHARLGDHESAIGFIRAAMDLYRQLDDRNGEGNCWAGLGESHHLLRRYGEAKNCYNRSIELYRGLGNRADEAYGLASLGDACRAAGEIESARMAWKTAWVIMNEFSLPRAAAVGAKLDGID
jgi:tetratricopeptide (TPR) repeat protein